MRLLSILFLLLISVALQAQHPIAFASKTELANVKKALTHYPLLKQSYTDLKKEVDQWLGKDVDVPFPKDAAGGYTHDKHKANYMLMFNSGLMYNLTGDARYATLVKNMFLKYAALNPQLKNHPQATSSSPGRIFWQALNDANWLVYTGLAYDLIYNTLQPAERKLIEEGAFKPEVDYFTKDLKNWFDLIHNHGVWACAGVGIVGIATNNNEYVQMALYGTEKNGKSGFLAQMTGLFSPDGYYTEGPYYVRYAILPYYIFANALHNARPELKIFEYRDSILKKALVAGLQQTNLDGTFLPLNDALKEKDYTSNELVTAINIAWAVYGANAGFLPVAKKQNRVLLNAGGTGIAAALAKGNVPNHYPYKTVEYKDGANGTEGGVSFLRMGKGESLTTLVYKYTAHGLSHGHYDKLGFFLFDKGNEVFQDYGSVRFINVEQKYGGRYLPENKTFAAQTIAHSTLVADERSHFDGKENEAEKYHPTHLFSDVNKDAVKVVSAKDVHAYKDIQMQRTFYMIALPDSSGRKLIVDVFNATSSNQHQYDLPFQYKGQLINTSFKYTPYTSTQEAFGKKNGYQFYWKEAEGRPEGTLSQFTFLNDKTYYTVSSLVDDSTRLYFIRSGANDPNFNLRHEPAYVVRKQGRNKLFLNAIEIHGQFNPVAEFSINSYPSVQSMQVLHNDGDYTVALITIGSKKLIVAQANATTTKQAKHTVTAGGQTYNWTGPFTVLYDGKTL